jgi:hypothetical protein
MRKILIITDYNGHSIKESLLIKYPYKSVKTTISEKLDFPGGAAVKDNWIGTNLSKLEFEDISVAIYSLDHRFTDDFVSHIEMLDGKYDDSEVLLFLGFHDLWHMKWKFNPEEVAYRYIESATKIFNKFKVITPIKNLGAIKKETGLEGIYNTFTDFIKNACIKHGIEHEDVNVLLGGIEENDYADSFNLKPEKCLPILDYMNA